MGDREAVKFFFATFAWLAIPAWLGEHAGMGWVGVWFAASDITVIAVVES
jgi:hypothetical protein